MNSIPTPPPSSHTPPAGCLLRATCHSGSKCQDAGISEKGTGGHFAKNVVSSCKIRVGEPCVYGFEIGGKKKNFSSAV